jgi:hypothetical protein
VTEHVVTAVTINSYSPSDRIDFYAYIDVDAVTWFAYQPPGPSQLGQELYQEWAIPSGFPFTMAWDSSNVPAGSFQGVATRVEQGSPSRAVFEPGSSQVFVPGFENLLEMEWFWR